MHTALFNEKSSVKIRLLLFSLAFYTKAEFSLIKTIIRAMVLIPPLSTGGTRINKSKVLHSCFKFYSLKNKQYK